MTDPDPTTEELRLSQLQRARSERERADHGVTDDDAEQHERRAEKAEYLRDKLAERARAEAESD
jgi:hypothetical protein